jgi:penicillin-binding protein 1A
VYLTIDPGAQINAHEAISKNLDQPTDPAASLVSIDENGRIIAMVGGKGYDTSQVNYALGKAGGGSGRAAGSTFKPFALAAFVEQGNSVKSVYTAPKELILPKADQGKDWLVKNFEDEDLGTVTVEEGTWHSANTVYAQIMQQVGSKAVAEMATRLGVSAEVSPVNSVVLGTSDVSVLDMATAYSTLANHGVKIPPYLIQRVETHGGKVLFEAGPPAKTQVVSPEVADTVTNVLRGVISKGTGTKALLKKVAAGKTGTTNDNKDAWFVGYTCHVTTAVWVGYDTPTSMLNIHNVKAVTGGTFPANIWRAFMSKATADESKCTYRNIDAGTNKLNPLLVPGPPTTTTVPPPPPVVPPADGTVAPPPATGGPVVTTAPPAVPAGTPPNGQATAGAATG